MDYLFVSIFIPAYAYLAYRRQELAFMFLVFALPLYVLRFRLFGFPTTLLELTLLTLVAVHFRRHATAIWTRAKDRFRAKGMMKSGALVYPFANEIVLLLFVSLAAVVVAGASFSAFGQWRAYFLEPALFYLLCFGVVNDWRLKSGKDSRAFRDTWSLFVIPLTASALFISLFAIYQKLTGAFIANPLWAAEATRRVTSIFPYPNAVGLYLGPLVVLIAAYAIPYFAKAWRSGQGTCSLSGLSRYCLLCRLHPTDRIYLVFLLSGIFSSLLAIYFARSEGALIAIAAAVLFAALFAERPGVRRPLRLSLLTIIIAFSSVIAIKASWREQVIDRLSLMDFSGQIRKAQWQDTGVFLRDGHWLLGAGLGAYQSRIAPYRSSGIYIDDGQPDFAERLKASPELRQKTWQPLETFLYPHNIFLNFWVELGLAGVALIVWLFFRIFVLGLSALRQIEDWRERFLLLAPLLAFIVILVHGIVDVPFFKNDLAILFFLLLALFSINSLDRGKQTAE